MTAFKLMTAAAAVWSVLVIAVSERDPPRPPEKVTDAIAERWLPEDPPAPKADRLTLAAPAAISLAPVEVSPPEIKLATVADFRQARAERPRNICVRHGMRKVSKRGGRSWRCR